MQTQMLKGFAYVLFSICIWAGWMVASRYAVRGTLTAYDITALRFGVGGLVLLPIVWRKGFAIGPWGVAGGFLIAFLIGAPYTNLAIAGMRFAPASHASTIINGTLLVLTTIVGMWGLREPTSPLRLVGVVCSLAGIACMLAAKSAYSGTEQWLGHLLFVVSGAMWGCYTLLVKHWKIEALHGAAIICVLSMLTYMPLYLAFAPKHILLASGGEVAFQAFYQGIMTAVVALISFNRGIAVLGASRAGALIPLVPVLSTLLAIPILGEIPSPLEWAGVGAVSFGVFLGSGLLGRRQRAQAPART